MSGPGHSIPQVVATPSVVLRCPLGHTKHVAPRDADDQHVCRECHLRMRRGQITGPLPTSSNNRLVPPPPRPEPCPTVDSKPQCDACAVGDHGRCTSVGCFCGTSPTTRDTHHATNHRRAEWSS